MKTIKIGYMDCSHSNNYNAKEAFFTKLLSQKYDVTASSFFRRGPLYGIASDDYADIITVFKDIFKK